jgi:ribonuclease HI
MNLVLHCDGGCIRKPGKPTLCYGSYQVTMDDAVLVRAERVVFTNCSSSNQAEYRALIAALLDIGQVLVDAKEYTIHVHSDSQIMIDGLMNVRPHKLHAPMGKLKGVALGLLGLFKSHTITWNSRKVNVKLFGH